MLVIVGCPEVSLTLTRVGCYVVQVVNHWGCCHVVLIHSFTVFTRNLVIFSSKWSRAIFALISSYLRLIPAAAMTAARRQLSNSISVFCLLKRVSPPGGVSLLPHRKIHWIASRLTLWQPTCIYVMLCMIDINFRWLTKSLTINYWSSINHAHPFSQLFSPVNTWLSVFIDFSLLMLVFLHWMVF